MAGPGKAEAGRVNIEARGSELSMVLTFAESSVSLGRGALDCATLHVQWSTTSPSSSSYPRENQQYRGQKQGQSGKRCLFSPSCQCRMHASASLRLGRKE